MVKDEGLGLGKVHSDCWTVNLLVHIQYNGCLRKECLFMITQCPHLGFVRVKNSFSCTMLLRFSAISSLCRQYLLHVDLL